MLTSSIGLFLDIVQICPVSTLSLLIFPSKTQHPQKILHSLAAKRPNKQNSIRPSVITKQCLHSLHHRELGHKEFNADRKSRSV